MGSWTCWLTGACTTHYGKIIGNLIIIAVCCTQRTKTFLFGLLIYIRTNRLYSLFYFSRTFFLSSLFASTLVDSESRSAYYANIERHAHRTCKYFRFQLEFVFTFPLSCTQYVDGGNLDVYLLGELKKESIAIRTETATESALFRFYSPVSFFFNSVWNVPLCRSLSSLPFLFYRPSIRRRFHKYSQTLKKKNTTTTVCSRFNGKRALYIGDLFFRLDRPVTQSRQRTNVAAKRTGVLLEREEKPTGWVERAKGLIEYLCWNTLPRKSHVSSSSNVISRFFFCVPFLLCRPFLSPLPSLCVPGANYRCARPSHFVFLVIPLLSPLMW